MISEISYYDLFVANNVWFVEQSRMETGHDFVQCMHHAIVLSYELGLERLKELEEEPTMTGVGGKTSVLQFLSAFLFAAITHCFKCCAMSGYHWTGLESTTWAECSRNRSYT